MELNFFKESPSTIIPNTKVLGTTDYPNKLESLLGRQTCLDAVREIAQWPGYEASPLHSLNKLAKELNLESIDYKDESGRFGLGSFKSLGGAYALLCLLKKQLSKLKGQEISLEDIRTGKYADDCAKITVVTATDGNHGRSVAWGARLFGCQCKIYMHSEVSLGRQKAVEDLGSEVIRVKGNYDESVRVANADAKAHGYFVVSDTSSESYLETPAQVMAGYTIMIDEFLEQAKDKLPTHVFVQAGVGGLAGAVCSAFWQLNKKERPLFVIVEPELADCLYQSTYNSKPTVVDIKEESIMAGLSCGKVSYIAWEILAAGAHYFSRISDELVAPCMKSLAKAEYGDASIEAGESAVGGLAALINISLNPEKRKTLKLDENSRVLMIGTEGATDPDIYKALVN